MGLHNFLFGWQSLGMRRGDLVLEVGGGNRPMARSDVLCDLGEYGDAARYGGSMPTGTVADRPFVYADAHRLPFRDHAFDFLVSAHMLEHLADPAGFLEEARRVAPRGCIITPSELFEKLIAERTHHWYVSTDGDRLSMRAKSADDRGCFGRTFQRVWSESPELRGLIWGRSDLFETRYRYADGVMNYSIDGTAREAPPPEPDELEEPAGGAAQRLASSVRSWLGRGVRALASRRRVDLLTLLACVVCGERVEPSPAGELRCSGCGRSYPRAPDGSPVMLEHLAHFESGAHPVDTPGVFAAKENRIHGSQEPA